MIRFEIDKSKLTSICLIFFIVRLMQIVCSLLCAATFVTAVTPPKSLCHGRPPGYFVQDVTTCSAYFRCEHNGDATRGICSPDGTNFDEPKQRCVWPEDSNCFQCPANITYTEIEVESHCNQFIRCIDSRPQHLDCAEGLVFDPELENCNFAHLVGCAANPPIECPAEDDPDHRVYERDPADCSR